MVSVNKLKDRIIQLRNDYEKAINSLNKYKVINEELKTKMTKMKNDYNKLFAAVNEGNSLPKVEKLNRKTIKTLADSNQNYKNVIKEKLERNEKKSQELSNTMKLMLKSNYDQKIKLVFSYFKIENRRIRKKSKRC